MERTKNTFVETIGIGRTREEAEMSARARMGEGWEIVEGTLVERMPPPTLVKVTVLLGGGRFQEVVGQRSDRDAPPEKWVEKWRFVMAQGELAKIVPWDIADAMKVIAALNRDPFRREAFEWYADMECAIDDWRNGDGSEPDWSVHRESLNAACDDCDIPRIFD